MNNKVNQPYCIVGLGRHAKTKLIPALTASNLKLLGLVSSQSSAELPHKTVFKTIDSALTRLPSNTIFIISTPPAFHFNQAKQIVEAGRDVIVEKPAFVSAGDVHSISKLALKKGVVVIEGFMHRYTTIYTRFIDQWNLDRKKIHSLITEFIIPNMPQATFRKDNSIPSSCVFDVGCYPISLLNDLKLPLYDLKVSKLTNVGQKGEQVEIVGKLDHVNVIIRIGVGHAYKNHVNIFGPGKNTSLFQPFFYGRDGNRTILSQEEGKIIKEEIIKETNAFENMFTLCRTKWLKNQNSRFDNMAEVTSTLERLGQELIQMRQINI